MTTHLRYAALTVGPLEVPNELSLVMTISGCDLRCPGCHSADLRDSDKGRELTENHFAELLDPYTGLVSCVCLLGGEWQPDALVRLLRQARSRHLKTCLYTGRTSCADEIARHLDFLKTGPYLASRGGLDQPGTNQRFLDLRKGRDLTALFQRGTNPSTQTLAA